MVISLFPFVWMIATPLKTAGTSTPSATGASESGDRGKRRERVHPGEHPARVRQQRGDLHRIDGECGKCPVGVPCSFDIPAGVTSDLGQCLPEISDHGVAVDVDGEPDEVPAAVYAPGEFLAEQGAGR